MLIVIHVLLIALLNIIQINYQVASNVFYTFIQIHVFKTVLLTHIQTQIVIALYASLIALIVFH